MKSAAKRGMSVLTPIVSHGPRQTRILTYHSVGDRDHEMNVSPREFEEQMKWLKDHATVISLDDAVRGMPGIAITLDDGYRDNLLHAVGILEAFTFPATVFVVPGRVGGFLDHDAEVETARLMTWDEIRALRYRGVQIGGHTMNHVRLSSVGEDECAEEIGRCAERIEEELGVAPNAFAYPFGSKLDYDARSIEAVQRAGYRYAVSNRYGPVDPRQSMWDVRRIWIDRNDTLATFIHKVCGDLDGLSVFDSALGIRTRRIMNQILGVD